jgi:polar amino acid transport system substrate-binding protein
LEQVNRVTRRRLLRSGLVAAAAAAASPLLAACGSSGTSSSASTAVGETVERLRSDGARLGVSAGPPSCGVEGGKAVGIFPEVAEVVLKRLGVDKFTPVLTSFAGIIPGLQAGRVDLALPGLYITAERCKAILFSHPVIRYGDALVVPHGNPDNIKTMDDVVKSDVKVGTLAGSTGAAHLKELGIPASRQVIFPDLPSILDGIKAGRVDVSGSDAIALGYLLKQGSLSDDLELIPEHTAKFSGAVGFAKDATDLQTAFDEQLRKAQAEGALTPIYEKWNVPADALDGVEKLTWQEQCRIAG